MAEWIFIKFGGYVSYAKINLGGSGGVTARIKCSYSSEQLHGGKMGGLEVS